VASCCERLTGYFRRAVRAAVLFMATPSAAAALATAAAANTPTIALGVDPLFEEWEMPSTLPQLAMCISNLALEQTNTFEKTDAATAGEEVPTAEAEESSS
jgi:H+/gluconate symporter-like permease